MDTNGNLKVLLLKDLCCRLPYRVICDRLGKHYPLVGIDIERELVYLLRDNSYVPYSILRGDIIKPYLRPMSSMTKEERNEYHSYCDYYYGTYFDTVGGIDWLNRNHFDYRKDDEGKTMIEKGLALEAPDGMYK